MHIPTLSLTLLTLLLAPSTLSASLQSEHLGGPTECARKSETGDNVSVHYRGSLLATGVEFDASYNRGQPLSFKLGAGRVIKGWDEGVVGMCIGEKRKLIIPPELGYGDRDMGPIPAGSTLVFETELVGIQGVKKDEL